jgi:hypothetical protein
MNDMMKETLEDPELGDDSQLLESSMMVEKDKEKDKEK